MNSIFIFFSVIFEMLSDMFISRFLPLQIGTGNYHVTEIRAGTGSDSWIVTLVSSDTKYFSRFKASSDNDGNIKIIMRSTSDKNYQEILVSIVVGVKFSIFRTDGNQGRELVFVSQK